MITVSDLSKAYDQSIAVNKLSFSVEPGQLLGLVGRNGAGKTTTLRCLTGIIPFAHGRIQIAGFDLASQPIEAKQHVAYVPDDPQLFADLTVLQHLQFAASVYRTRHAADSIHQMLEMFDLSAKANSPASSLSRGMRQKLAICSAYVSRPDVLLLDEPMTGLDPQAIRTLKSSIVEKAANGCSIIISSHLLAMVEDICSHVLILEMGQQTFYGDLAQLRQQYATNADDAAMLEDAFFAATSSGSIPVQSWANASSAAGT